MIKSRKKNIIKRSILIFGVCVLLFLSFNAAFVLHMGFQSRVVTMGINLRWMKMRPGVSGEYVVSDQFLPPPDDVVLAIKGKAISLSEEDKAALYACFTDDMNDLSTVDAYKMRFEPAHLWEFFNEDVSIEFRYKTPQSFVGNIIGVNGGKSPVPEMFSDEEWGSYPIPHFTYDAVVLCSQGERSFVVAAHENGKYYGLANVFNLLYFTPDGIRTQTLISEISNR